MPSLLREAFTHGVRTFRGLGLEEIQTNHIAVLVRSISAVEGRLPGFCTRHPIEEQPTEGTLEQYITFGGDSVPALLLMQAIKEGPYMRALNKRGTGFHHAGCICGSIEQELASGTAGNLLLHPLSLKTIRHDTLWLCRPGLPFLVELMQSTGQALPCIEDVRVKLPCTVSIPDYATDISGNLEIGTGEVSSFSISTSGFEVTFDPNEIKE